MAELNIVTVGIVILAVIIAAIAIAFVVGVYTEGTKATEEVKASELIDQAKGQLDSVDNDFSVIEQLQGHTAF